MMLLWLSAALVIWMVMKNEQAGGISSADSGEGLFYLGPEVLGSCWDKMDKAFIARVDRFMFESPGEWMVSPAPGATCRDYGSATSRHYAVGRQADAIDIMLVSGDLRENYEFARERFGGVGVYPDWEPYPGLHLDGRDGSATWAGVRVAGVQEYVGVTDEVFA